MHSIALAVVLASLGATPPPPAAPDHVSIAGNTWLYTAPNTKARKLRSANAQRTSWRIVAEPNAKWLEVRPTVSPCIQGAYGLQWLDLSLFVKRRDLGKVLVNAVTFLANGTSVELAPGSSVSPARTKGHHTLVTPSGIAVTTVFSADVLGFRYRPSELASPGLVGDVQMLAAKTTATAGSAKVLFSKTLKVTTSPANGPRAWASIDVITRCAALQMTVASTQLSNVPAGKPPVALLSAFGPPPYPTGTALTWTDGTPAGKYEGPGPPVGFKDRTGNKRGVCWPLRINTDDAPSTLKVCGPKPSANFGKRVQAWPGPHSSSKTLDAALKASGEVSPPATPSTTNIVMGKLEVAPKGALDTAVVKRLFRRQQRALLHCHTTGLPKHSTLLGKRIKFRAEVTIGPNGRSTGVTIDSHKKWTKKTAALRTCMEGRLRTWSYPAPQTGKDTTVTQQFTLSSQKPAKKR